MRLKRSGHCSVGACKRCTGMSRNGDKAREPYWFCTHECHEPVQMRRDRLIEMLGFDPWQRRKDELSDGEGT